MIISQRIKKLRKSLHISQAEFGKRINVAKSTISCYETGKRNPPIEIIQAISDEYQVNVNYILGNDSYEIAENDKDRGINMAKEEIDFIVHIRGYTRVHKEIIKDPKRCADSINRNI